MTPGSDLPGSPESISLFLRADADGARVVLRGEANRAAGGWRLEWRAPGGSAQGRATVLPAGRDGLIDWIISLLDRDLATRAR